VGCGRGALAAALADLGYEVTGVASPHVLTKPHEHRSSVAR
jgi:2-polyprenyl-3-methyl-5-hydroxy-6-metoxy-1,4-benzoquinol methylase